MWPVINQSWLTGCWHMCREARYDKLCCTLSAVSCWQCSKTALKVSMTRWSSVLLSLRTLAESASMSTAYELLAALLLGSVLVSHCWCFSPGLVESDIITCVSAKLVLCLAASLCACVHMVLCKTEKLVIRNCFWFGRYQCYGKPYKRLYFGGIWPWSLTWIYFRIYSDKKTSSDLKIVVRFWCTIT